MERIHCLHIVLEPGLLHGEQYASVDKVFQALVVVERSVSFSFKLRCSRVPAQRSSSHRPCG